MKLKLIIVIGFVLLITSTIFVQSARAQTQVKWEYSSRKLTKDTYEIRLKAKLQKGWHIYSQTTPMAGRWRAGSVLRKIRCLFFRAM